METTKKFNQRCYEILMRVPKGKVTTYKAIAEMLGTKAYRAVGNAMKHNPLAPKIPCHRVVNNNGFVGMFAQGTKKKIKLLRREGIKIDRNGFINLEKYRYLLN